MLKSYLRYEHTATHGVICSSNAPTIRLVHAAQELLATPAYGNVLIWHARKGMVVKQLVHARNESEITCLTASRNVVAAGRFNGGIDLWDVANIASTETTTPKTSFSGHHAQVSCAVFSLDGARLVTGSRDTFIIVWDPVGEVGLFRLKGHKDEITSMAFLTPSRLVSSCKDSILKVWDLDVQQCVNTVIEHTSPVWAVAVACPPASTTEDANNNHILVATGCSDGLLRTLEFDISTNAVRLRNGSIGRKTSDRVETMCFSDDGLLLAIQSTGRVLEFYSVRNEADATKKRKRRLQRAREKDNGEETGKKDEDEQVSQLWTQDELEFAIALRLPHRARSVALGPLRHIDDTSTSREFIVSFKNNLVHTYQLVQQLTAVHKEDGEITKRHKKSSTKRKLVTSVLFVSALELQGHRSDIRGVCLSESEDLFVTAGDGACKVWNVESGTCIRTLPTGTSLCCLFLPGDLHCVVGTRAGALQVFELSSGNVWAEILDAHAGAINSIDMRRDQRGGFMTGSSDQTCKFWSIDMKKKTLVHTRTLKVGDDVQCAKYTKSHGDKMKIVVALLDNTVKIFHDDSLEFHVSLYGHKLPVLACDTTDDDELVVTGGTDKTMKIWGLDFGDCHRSVFAHDGSVTSLVFAPRTHYALSAGRDGKIRYWDCDHFQQIMSFDQAHYGDVWGLTMSRDASMFLSVGKDKAICVWRRSREMVFAEEEKELELEKTLDKQDLDELKGRSLGDVIPALAVVAGGGDGGVDVAEATKRQTREGLEASERLLETLDGNNDDVFLVALRRMRPQDLEEAAILWPFARVHDMLSQLGRLLTYRSNEEVELVCKLILRLVKIHFQTIASNPDTFKDLMGQLANELRNALGEIHTSVGLNLAGLRRAKVLMMTT